MKNKENCSIKIIILYAQFISIFITFLFHIFFIYISIVTKPVLSFQFIDIFLAFILNCVTNFYLFIFCNICRYFMATIRRTCCKVSLNLCQMFL